jgi:hypothetical protein
MAIEIVDLPSYKIVIFHSYVKLPEDINLGVHVDVSFGRASAHIPPGHPRLKNSGRGASHFDFKAVSKKTGILANCHFNAFYRIGNMMINQWVLHYLQTNRENAVSHVL